MKIITRMLVLVLAGIIVSSTVLGQTRPNPNKDPKPIDEPIGTGKAHNPPSLLSQLNNQPPTIMEVILYEQMMERAREPRDLRGAMALMQNLLDQGITVIDKPYPGTDLNDIMRSIGRYSPTQLRAWVFQLEKFYDLRDPVDGQKTSFKIYLDAQASTCGAGFSTPPPAAP
jgi:hypothetical protein